MQKIKLDTGVRQYRLGAGVLQFNPADPNVYSRFGEAAAKLPQIELMVKDRPDEDGMEAMNKADRELKELLGWAFGPGNDFEQMLGGVSLLAAASNGRTVLENLLEALEPVLEEGARCCAALHSREAVQKATARRGAV